MSDLAHLVLDNKLSGLTIIVHHLTVLAVKIYLYVISEQLSYQMSPEKEPFWSVDETRIFRYNEANTMDAHAWPGVDIRNSDIDYSG